LILSITSSAISTS